MERPACSQAFALVILSIFVGVSAEAKGDPIVDHLGSGISDKFDIGAADRNVEGQL